MLFRSFLSLPSGKERNSISGGGGYGGSKWNRDITPPPSPQIEWHMGKVAFLNLPWLPPPLTEWHLYTHTDTHFCRTVIAQSALNTQQLVSPRQIVAVLFTQTSLRISHFATQGKTQKKKKDWARGLFNIKGQNKWSSLEKHTSREEQKAFV